MNSNMKGGFEDSTIQKWWAGAVSWGKNDGAEARKEAIQIITASFKDLPIYLHQGIHRPRCYSQVGPAQL